MQRRTFIAMGLAGLATAPALAQSTGWVTLFDGKSLDGWTKIGESNVALADGVVQADKGNGYLVWKDEFGDFELRAEIFVSDDANSGVFVRFPDRSKPSAKTGYEFNIYDRRPDPTYGTGAIVDVAKVDPMPKAGGKWNLMEITCKGAELSYRLNGQVTADKVKGDHSLRGFIGLQFGGGVVRFRKVEIRAL